MGLSASMYSGTSGLKAHGEKMTVIGNNISNVSTIGYKGSRMYFEDALSQEVTTAAGVGQVGRGVAVGAVMGDFSQGSLESTTESTDLAVGGNGFFVVSPAGQEVNYYTRAGNFRFNEDGFLVDPHGYRLQGWAVEQKNTSAAASGESTQSTNTGVQISGVPQDIKLENFQSPPQATSRVDMILNVDSKSADKSTADGDPPATTPLDGKPFTALFNSYDANSLDGTPLGSARYAYQSTIKVYDDNGTSHNLTVFMDPVSDPDVVNNAGGKRYWEYVVTVPPNEDNREFWGVQTDTSKKGVLMTGVLTFNASGELENMSAYTINNPYNGTGGVEPAGTTPVTYTAGKFATDASRMENWTPANFSQNGYPICTANFLGAKNGSITATDDDAGTGNIPPKDMSDASTRNNIPSNIEINFGLRNKATTWNAPGGTLADLQNTISGSASADVTTTAAAAVAAAADATIASKAADASAATAASSAATAAEAKKVADLARASDVSAAAAAAATNAAKTDISAWKLAVAAAAADPTNLSLAAAADAAASKAASSAEAAATATKKAATAAVLAAGGSTDADAMSASTAAGVAASNAASAVAAVNNADADAASAAVDAAYNSATNAKSSASKYVATADNDATSANATALADASAAAADAAAADAAKAKADAAAIAAADAAATAAQAALSSMNGMAAVEASALSTTNYSTGSTTIFQAQDGYTAGFLQNISVDRDGVITGRYSNGQVLQLFAVTLATFNNNYALYREGGNLFSETRASGPSITGLANTGGKGSIASNSLEQSNVDLATEFVKMISTEKGFQANSKTITTVDQMLTTLIQLKR